MVWRRAETDTRTRWFGGARSPFRRLVMLIVLLVCLASWLAGSATLPHRAVDCSVVSNGPPSAVWALQPETPILAFVKLQTLGSHVALSPGPDVATPTFQPTLAIL